MDKRKINLLKAIFEICLVAVVILMISKVMMLKTDEGYDQVRSFYKQKNNTVDAIFLGSSKFYRQVDTGLLWDDYGISAYDLGAAEATTWNSYYWLKEALKTQHPKVILYEASEPAFIPDEEYQNNERAMTNNYGIKWGENRIRQLYLNTPDYDTFRHLLFPLDSMHSRYSEITKEDFVNKKDSISYKGFKYKNGSDDILLEDVSNVTERVPLSEKQEEYLVKMMELSKQEDIPFVAMVAPVAVYSDEQKILNYIEDLCNENGVRYYDCNRVLDEIGIDLVDDFAERTHMNFVGSEKYAKFLGKFLTEEYDLTDHRGDADYSSWEDAALVDRHNRLANKLGKANDFNEAVALLNDQNYVSFVVDDKSQLFVSDGGIVVASSNGDEPFEYVLENEDKTMLLRKEEDIITLNIGVDFEKTLENPNKYIIVYDRALEKVVLNKEYDE